MSGTRLDELKIDEVSGVDGPANQLPGWMVLKSADDVTRHETQLAALYATLGGATVLDDAPEEIVKAREVLELAIESILSEPERPKETLMQKMKRLVAPRVEAEPEKEPVVEKATEPEKTEAVEKTEEVVVEPEKAPEAEPVEAAPVVKATEPEVEEEYVSKADGEAIGQTLDVFREAMGGMLDRLENIEKALTGSAQHDGQEEPVTKSAPTLRDGIISAAMGNRVTIS